MSHKKYERCWKLETSSEQCAGLEVTRHTWVPDVVSCQSRCQLLCCCVRRVSCQSCSFFPFSIRGSDIWPIFCHTLRLSTAFNWLWLTSALCRFWVKKHFLGDNCGYHVCYNWIYESRSVKVAQFVQVHKQCIFYHVRTFVEKGTLPELARPRPRPEQPPGHDMSGFEAQSLTTGARLYPGLVCEFWVWAEIPGTVTWWRCNIYTGVQVQYPEFWVWAEIPGTGYGYLVKV